MVPAGEAGNFFFFKVLLGGSEDGVELFLERFAFTEWPVGFFLVTEDDVIEDGLRHSQ